MFRTARGERERRLSHFVLSPFFFFFLKEAFRRKALHHGVIIRENKKREGKNAM